MKTGLASHCFDRILETNSLKGKKNWLMVSGVRSRLVDYCAGACGGGTHIMEGGTWQRRAAYLSGLRKRGDRRKRGEDSNGPSRTQH